MRLSSPLSLFLLPASALQISSLFSEFSLPEDALLSNETSLSNGQHELLKRDGNCPDNHNSCSTLQAAAGGACCTAGTSCTRDGGGNVACCPIGAKCTGTVIIGSGTTALGGGIVFGSVTSSTNSPGITMAPKTAAGAASVVQNPYFPFPYIPTSYVNSAVCNTAYSACQANYAACTNDLMGNSFGVTVVAPDGGGVTVAPTAANLDVASATSICSSLSAQACYNIQSGNCAQFGSGTETGGQFIVATQGNHAARQTVGCMAAAGLVAGLGIAGRMI